MKPQEIFRIALVQAPLSWEDPSSNRSYFSEQLKSLSSSDLVLLPEMFSTGFSMNPAALAETMEGESLNWLKDQAQEQGFALSGSLIIEEEGYYFNRLFFVYPDGSFRYYDKRHLFSYAGEEKVYTAGREKLILEYCGWKINPQICYDLRFPVWCRNAENFDLQFFVANWPARRSGAWKTLLQARAIENQVYLAGLNRIGDDGNGIYHSGDSALFDPLGEKLSQIEPGKAQSEIIKLSYSHLQKVRERFAFLKDRDQFNLEV